MNEKLEILHFVKDNFVTFERYKQGFFYYSVVYPPSISEHFTGNLYEFPIPIEDIGQGEVKYKEKAMLFMRWIRMAMKDGTLVNITDRL